MFRVSNNVTGKRQCKERNKFRSTLAPPLPINSDEKAIQPNQAFSEFLGRGGWGVRGNHSLKTFALSTGFRNVSAVTGLRAMLLISFRFIGTSQRFKPVKLSFRRHRFLMLHHDIPPII